VAADSKDICIYKVMHAFPSPDELVQLLNCFQPDFVLLSLDGPFEDALLLTRQISMIRPVAILGFSQTAESERLSQAVKAGVSEVVTEPLTCDGFRKGFQAVIRKAGFTRHEKLLAFLPAKAGCGASTVGLNVAARLANDTRQKVLLIDADLRSGLLSEMLKVNATYSVVNALQDARVLDGLLGAKWR